MQQENKPTSFDITRKVLGRTLVLSFNGVADLACIDRLESELIEAVATRPQHVLIDTRHLESIAALVNGSLSVFASSVRRNGGDVCFVGQPASRCA